jgi:uncharacterized membrane protein required for colicin V production
MLVTLLLLLIFVACIGFCYAEGLWTNALRLVNVVMAALLAMNFWEPAAAWLDGMLPSYTYMWDFLSLWGLFVIFFSVLRAVTDLVSGVKVRFLKLADRIGSGLCAVCVGWVMVCFTATSLHTAPLARNFLFGSFNPEARAGSLFSSEVAWLGFTQKLSRGVYCRSASEQDWKTERTVFDPRGEFLVKYATRRANLEAHVAKTNAFRVAE